MLVKACAGCRSYRKGENGVRHMGEFGCSSCGSPAVELPSPLRLDAPVLCGGCGRVIGTWLAFQAMACKEIEAAKRRSGYALRWHSSDPLPFDPADALGRLELSAGQE
jgi:hypothetical protein